MSLPPEKVKRELIHREMNTQLLLPTLRLALLTPATVEEPVKFRAALLWLNLSGPYWIPEVGMSMPFPLKSVTSFCSKL